MTHKLEADSIRLSFNNRQILSDVYLSCETGTITGLLGRNGQGKSSLMKIIYGTLACEKSIRIDRISQQEAGRKPELLRYLPQFNFTPKQLTIKQIFRDFDLSFDAFADRFPEFTEKYKTPVGLLSGGERRSIELYAIVKSRSQFVMLDEPFTHLNPLQIEKVKALLLEEKKNKGILISDHMYRHVIDVCDRLYVLSNGKTHLTTSIDDIESLGYARL